MDTLGSHVRHARLTYGMSQAELARRISISQTALNQIELGTTHDPHFSIVQRIAHVLGLSLDDFPRHESDQKTHMVQDAH